MKRTRLVAAIGLVLLGAVNVAGLQQGGSIAGRVVLDGSTPCPMPPCTTRAPGISITVTTAGVERRTVTDHDGKFSIGNLPPAVYRVRAELSPFRTEMSEPLEVVPGRVAEVNFVMRLSVFVLAHGQVPFFQPDAQWLWLDAAETVAYVRIVERLGTELLCPTPGCPEGSFVSTRHAATVVALAKSSPTAPLAQNDRIEFWQPLAGEWRGSGGGLVGQNAAYEPGDEVIVFLRHDPEFDSAAVASPLPKLVVRDGVMYGIPAGAATGFRNGMSVNSLLASVRALVAERAQQPGRAGIDCADAIRRGDPDAIIPLVEPLPPDARRRCVDELFQLVADPQKQLLAEYAARAIEALAQRRLIDNAAGLLAPLIACEARSASMLPGYCNRALAALTKHEYGRAMFAGQAGAAPRTPENVARNVADWTEYDRLFGKGHPVFDASLADQCVRAIRDIGSRLADLLADATPGHAAIGYLRTTSKASTDTFRYASNRIWSIGMGDLGLGPGFALPGNWVSTAGMRGLRVLLFRPGIPASSFPDRPDAEIQAFPPAASDYRETFTALDLELRFQIVTPDAGLRSRAAAAVRESLADLRDADARALR